MQQDKIRNFCIIAHINHGKSTLADRFLETTNTIDKRNIKKQTLDSMELEREKGITIKLKAVRMFYKDYELNLIDTPGHVDFSYEVSRSLAACEGAILVVDASQGIQAQTVSNVYKAINAHLKIIPVINKIDLKNINVKEREKELVETFGFKPDEIIKVSAKTGENTEEILNQIIKRVPAPQGGPKAPSRGLVFDSFYDEYLGVVASVRVFDGSFDSKKHTKIKFLGTEKPSDIVEIGYFQPNRKKTDSLSTGQVGYIATGLKDIQHVKVGDTVTLETQSPQPLPGYKEIKPFVFVSLYPLDNSKFQGLRAALEKLSLSDSSLSYEPETNDALGFGFRCGFLGLLHADIVQERLEREYNLELISTVPSVEYKVKLTSGKIRSIRNPSKLPDRSVIENIKEPWILCNIISPSEYAGAIITLCEDRRGKMIKMEYPREIRYSID